MRKPDKKILLHLEKGEKTTNKVLTKKLGYQRTYLWERLQHLIEEGYLKKIDRGLYGITDKGREKAKQVGGKGENKKK